ncbi:MAG: VOC family protein [Schleiferiaceae bacterium]|jgi:catechol 2,3-dioxygenase-like lactoylglutathione lyase family enzyme|nr:VOC family protein [Schleiferiaceae bacterium]
MKNPFEDSELTTIIVVADMAKAKHFYLEVLGAELFREYGGSSVVLKFLHHWILLVTEGGETADKPGTAFTPNKNKNKIDKAYTIRVKDCQSSYKILKDRGAEFITPPYDWGQEIRCFFRDPDDNLFEISEYKG